MDGLKRLKPLKPEYSAVLKNRGFLFLWMGQLLSQLADRLFMYVVLLLAYSLTLTNVGVSVPMLAFGVPSVLFGSLAGVFVDRWNRKRILVFSNVFRGALVLLLIPLMNQSLILIFAIAFVLYTITQFFAPAETSSIPSLVEKRDLIVANSLMMVTWMVSSVIGFGLGSPLTVFFGMGWTLAISTLCYVGAALLVSFVPVKQKRERGMTLQEMFTELLAGFEYIRRNVIVQFSFLKMATATTAMAVISVLAISFTENILKLPAESFGLLVFLAGLGMLASLLFMGRVSAHVKKGHMIAFGFFFSGLTLIGLMLSTQMVVALLFSFFLGVGNAFIMVPVQTILQERVPDQIRGRVFGVQNMVINSAFTLPVVFFGWLADGWGLKTVLVLLAAMLVGNGILGMLAPKFREV